MSLGHARRTVVHVSVDTLRMKLEAGASGDRCEACQHTPSEVHCHRLKSDLCPDSEGLGHGLWRLWKKKVGTSMRHRTDHT
jgi:hypothetical protein